MEGDAFQGTTFQTGCGILRSFITYRHLSKLEGISFGDYGTRHIYTMGSDVVRCCLSEGKALLSNGYEKQKTRCLLSFVERLGAVQKRCACQTEPMVVALTWIS